MPLLAPSLMKVNPSLVFRRFLEILERLSHQGKLLKNSSSCAFSSMLISRELSFPGFQSGGRRRGWGEAHNQGIDLLLTHGLHTSTTWSPTWQTVCCSSSWNHRWELMENLLKAQEQPFQLSLDKDFLVRDRKQNSDTHWLISVLCPSLCVTQKTI